VPFSTPTPTELAALIVAISFAAGLNVYATVATLGLLARLNWIELPGNLDMLTSWWIIGASGVLFVMEYVAESIPIFDLVWTTLQTFVRIPVAGVLAWAATPELGPGWQAVAAMVGGTIALAAHGGKTAARASIASSPEPFSNIILSTAEHAFTVFLVWFASEHPYLAAAIALVALAVVIVLIRVVFLALRAMFRGARARWAAPGAVEAAAPGLRTR
jgi:hypothetical protein